MPHLLQDVYLTKTQKERYENLVAQRVLSLLFNPFSVESKIKNIPSQIKSGIDLSEETKINNK